MSRRRVALVATVCVVALLAAPALGAQAKPDPMPDVSAAIRTGKYAEAIAALGKVARTDSAWVDAQVRLARVLTLTGKYDDAERIARAAASKDAANTLGEVLRERGKLAAAESAFVRAVSERGRDSLTASLNLAILHYDRGERDRAMKEFDHFIDVYNNRAPSLTSREMEAVAIACRYLGVGNPQLFKDALTAFDRAIALDPDNLEVKIALGEMFLAKYNGTDAQKTFEELLAVNPSHPRTLVGTAQRLIYADEPGADSLVNRALAVNPEYVPARVLMARGLLDVERYADAAKEAERALRTNPNDADALAVFAAAKFVSNDNAGFDALRQRAVALNAHDAGFFVTLAEMAGRVRLYAKAAEFARAGVAADSTNWKAHSLLGMNLLRLGKIAAGRAELEVSFKGDPYDGWVKNTLDLLDTYKNYDESTTEHARFMIEKAESGLLSIYLGDLVERAYKTYQARYAFTPADTIRIEVYRSHADFSVRTAGMPGIGALGVSFGTTLAFDSPAARDAGPFNWGSTVWHELAHTFTLGLTDHRVPRWLSEGLSVWEEHKARPGWGFHVTPQFLEAYRAGKLVPVSRMNDGFMHPAYPGQVQFSYFQASVVCDLIARDFGEKALVAMLNEYKAGRTTEEVFQKVLSSDMKSFDQRFDRYMRERYATPLAALAEPAPEYPQGMTPEQLKAKADSLPRSLRAQMLAGAALVRGGQIADAITVLERARALFPEYAGPESAPAMLAQLYVGTGETKKAMAMLELVSLGNEAELEANVTLSRLAEQAGDSAKALDALDRAVFVNPFPPELHVRLAELAQRAGDKQRVVRERRAVVALDPVDKADALYKLALAYRDVGDQAGAKRAVLRALEEAPNFEKAQELLLAIVDGKGER